MLSSFKSKPGLLGALAAGVVSAVVMTPVVADTKFISVGTGGQTGMYYVTGQSICKMVNRDTAKHNLRCSAPATGGSIANINEIKAGNSDMGVAQSDWQFHAYNGTSKFEDSGPYPKLRSVFSIHGEPMGLIARADSGIKHLNDLPGKRVNIGNPGSGQRGTMEVIMEAKGWTKQTFSLAAELKSSEHGQALCDNKLDAFVLTTGHPSAAIKEAAATCAVKVIPVDGPEIDQLVEKFTYYAYSPIPGGTYTGTDEDVNTFGPKATFVTSSDVDEKTIYELTKSVFENLDRFKRINVVFANLEVEGMLNDGMTAPIHDGAAKYYKEKGWKYYMP